MTALFDVHMLVQVLLAAAIGGIIGLDRTALGQFMFSQPVIAGPLTGWFLGDLTAGLVIGGALELVWVLDMPIGTFVPADSTVAAVSGTAIAVLAGGPPPAQLPVIGFSLLLTVGMVPVTMFADHLMRQRNAQIPELALSSRGRPTEVSATAWHLAGLIAFFLKSFVLCLVLVPAGLVLMSGFLALPASVHRAMALFATSLPLLGVASVARKLSLKTLDRYLLTGFFVGAVSVQLFHLPQPAAVALAVLGGLWGMRNHVA